MTALPNDEVAERALLGHILNRGEIPKGVNGLAPGDFYRPVNETIWAAMRTLSDQGKPCDLPSVVAYLDKLGQLERGTPQHNSRKVTDLGLFELLQAPPIVDPTHAAGNIREHARRRQLILLHQRGLQQANDPTSDPEELLRRATEEFGRMQGSGEKAERSSWRPVDLGPVLDGTWTAPQPTVGRRSDGKGIFYLGKTHTGIGETEAGKGWFALSAAVDEMADGNHVVYVDFEDDEGGVVGRLLNMGISRRMIEEHFEYIHPEHPLKGRHLEEFLAVLNGCKPTLAFLDGVTQAMTMHGLNPLDNVDIAVFDSTVVRHFTTTGAAELSLDHVVKDREGRGRYALGGVHKLNIVSGAGYILENRQPFGIGMTGRSTIKIAKDRPGQLRVNALPTSGGLHWYGDLAIKSHGEGFAEVSIEPAHEHDGSFKPTELMQKISDLLAAKGPLSKNKIETAIRGKTDYKRQALTLLIIDGYVSDGDAKNPHELLRPFEVDE